MQYKLKYIYLILILIFFPFFLVGKERKKINDELKKTIEQIEDIKNTTKSHGELIYQIQQELLENKKETDILRGKIQEIQHKLKKNKEK